MYVDVQVKSHDLFERDEDDLFQEIFIPFTLATLGGTVEAATLDGKVTLKIPAGTPCNKTFRIRDKGMPNLRSPSHKGDLYVKAIIDVPQNLNKEQRQKLVDFGLSCGEKDIGEDSSILNKAKRFFEGDG